MSRAIIRLIFLRESRDLIRDRRTVLLLIVLPVLLYPGFYFVALLFALTMLDQVLVVGLVGGEHLTPTSESVGQAMSVPQIGWLFPDVGGATALDHAVVLAAASARAQLEYPPLTSNGRIADRFCVSAHDAKAIKLTPVTEDPQDLLDEKKVDVILIVPAGFLTMLDREERPVLEIQDREDDEKSKDAVRRLTAILKKYEAAVRQVRFARRGLPGNFDDVISVRDPMESQTKLQRVADEFRDSLIRFFPFMLVMWSLAGALHPAIDVCAGEKERGTMETLLISPAERSEIVVGKFLAVWFFSTLTAEWNLAWMGGGAVLFGHNNDVGLVSAAGLIWCAIIIVPLSGLFSALSVALGAYARSAKEGQYYLLPLFLGSLPLVLLSIMPNAELSFGYSLVPITGACLLLQQLMKGGTDPWLWLHAVTVVVSLTACAALALRWAVYQFQREDVLFRESEPAGLFRRRPPTNRAKLNSS